ncbi:DNA-binding protein [Mycolicibacterium acapulense]|uniref:DNA-binding protein n=1 Tax=Mycobacterium lehmannii TaxID=2048550 RepID=A0A101A4P0_9MYCO|nr:helix-turn-helix domain-containing protein [Mycobacterium lehmannii]KUI03933.1 DNA-binding protein [Mycolicibacterium acapulense]KUI13239.1 DNA-binding protein [Mycobacterium lehmannii]KUI13543.1 DNA-binding protein [Mycolicibacterium acapulense]
MDTNAPTESVPTLDELRNGPPTISVERAGKVLGVSRAYAYAMARDGRLPTIRLGAKRLRVSAVGLLRMLEAQ